LTNHNTLYRNNNWWNQYNYFNKYKTN